MVVHTVKRGVWRAWPVQEIDFVASDMSLEIIGDFAVVWLLSPRKSFSPLPKSVLGRVYKALPGHALQATSSPHGSTATHLCSQFL